MKLSLDQIGKILSCSISVNQQVNSYAIDSRKVQQGGLFFALKGNTHNGHDYLQDISQKGAVAAVVDKNYEGFAYGLVLFFVDDVLEALQTLARETLQQLEIKVIGVTGSVGKTSTKEIIYQLISKMYKVHTSKKNYNSQTMLPISILEAEGDEDYLLLEMGMTEKGQIKKLISIAPPDIVVITPITYCHYENFSSLEEIAEVKAEILHPMVKYAIIHKENIDFDVIYKQCIADQVIYPSDNQILSPFKETHFTENFIAGHLLAKYIGMNDDQIRLASLSLSKMKLEHRFEKIYRGGVLFIDDSYNANTLSTSVAIQNLPLPPGGGRKILVFGEMKELGVISITSHQIIANLAVLSMDIALCKKVPGNEIFSKMSFLKR